MSHQQNYKKLPDALPKKLKLMNIFNLPSKSMPKTWNSILAPI